MTISQITFSTPKRRHREQSRIVVTARFRDRSSGDETPTNIYARVDNLSTGAQVRDWTSVTVANPATITLTPTETKVNRSGIERLQITVQADRDLAGAYTDTHVLEIENVRGLT